MPVSQPRYDIGLKIRKEVLGEEHVDRALAGADDFNRDFQELVTEYCWGGTWARQICHQAHRIN